MANEKFERSEANRISGKKNFRRYNLTRYPNNLDTRENNTNMRGFINIGETRGIPDYVMAEYMNAAMDGIMALQQAVGTEPMVYHGATETENLIEKFTVSDRIERIENGLFDERYGGNGWTYNNKRPVLNNHNHDGKNGHPEKIRLTKDVTGLLPYKNINLNYGTGLTGAHISLAPSNSTKLNIVIEDLLSKPQGGTVSGDVSFTGVVKTRTSIDATALDISAGRENNIVSDNQATSGRSLTSKRTNNQERMFTIKKEDKEHLLYGRYVLGVRMKKGSSSENHTNLINFKIGNSGVSILDTDISTEYKTIHFIFEHNQNTKLSSLTLDKLATTQAQEIRVDSYYITPIHPATLDI